MSKKIGFVFPGQGSQKVGMGKDLYENFTNAREIIEKASEILDLDFTKILFEGPEELLNNTKNTQPAIFTVSFILDRLLKEKGIEPVITAGHSLGEYSALASVNSLTFAEGLKLVKKRGQLMDEAVPQGQGSMAAIIGLDKEKIKTLCKEIEGVLEIANYNTPNQIVVSGASKAIKTILNKAEERGARKALELKVSGPFHSSLMEPVQDQFKQEIEKINIKNADIPIIANVTAKSIFKNQDIKQELLSQLTSSVLWVDSINLMIEKGINTIIEVGPGRVLKSLIRRIDRSPEIYNVQDKESLENTVKNII